MRFWGRKHHAPAASAAWTEEQKEFPGTAIRRHRSGRTATTVRVGMEQPPTPPRRCVPAPRSNTPGSKCWHHHVAAPLRQSHRRNRGRSRSKQRVATLLPHQAVPRHEPPAERFVSRSLDRMHPLAAPSPRGVSAAAMPRWLPVASGPQLGSSPLPGVAFTVGDEGQQHPRKELGVRACTA